MEYSFKKVQKMTIDEALDEALDEAQDEDLLDGQLEILESFSSRFARFSDLIVSRYFRVLAFEKDPAFRGSAIDLLNVAEKFNWIESSEVWKTIRELRNVAAHDYAAEDYLALYKKLIELTPELLKVNLSL